MKLVMKNFLQIAVVSLLLVSSAFAQSDDDYVQVERKETGHPKALKTSIVRMNKGDVIVDLISAIHVGDKQYYGTLNEKFKQYDALLYELVAPKEHDVAPSTRSDEQNPLLKFQLWLTRVLGLSFQLEEIDYSAANFVHADVSPKEFAKSMKDRGETFPKMVMRVLMASAMMPVSDTRRTADALLLLTLLEKNTPQRKAKMRRLLAEEFQDMGGLIAAINGDEGSTLITARNQKAIDVLKEQLALGKKKLGVFYGAGHMPDFEVMLKEQLGFKRQAIDWVVAWDIQRIPQKKSE